jgi:hypothetical protein
VWKYLEMMKTWQAEFFVVAAILGVLVLFTRGNWVEGVGALAVLLNFGHSQVADRLAEKEAAKSQPDVDCHRWLRRYFFGKEILWLIYFVIHQSWSALAGVCIFLAYPLWRRWWRK